MGAYSSPYLHHSSPVRRPVDRAVAVLSISISGLFSNPGHSSLLRRNARIIMPNTNSHIKISRQAMTVPKTWMARAPKVLPTACVAVTIAVLGNTKLYHVMSKWMMWRSRCPRLCRHRKSSVQCAPMLTSRNHRHRPHIHRPAMSARSLRNAPAWGTPEKPSGMIFACTMLPRCTMPATVNPLGPTETN